MRVAPDGDLSLAGERLRSTLAGLASFQRFVGVTTADEAAAHVFLNGLPPHAPGQLDYSREELAHYRPWAIVWTQRTGNGFTWSNRNADGVTSTSGRLCFDLEREIPAEFAGDVAAEDTDFENHIGRIGAELAASAFSGGMPILDMNLADGPATNDPKEHPRKGRLQGVSILVVWGVGGEG